MTSFNSYCVRTAVTGHRMDQKVARLFRRHILVLPWIVVMLAISWIMAYLVNNRQSSHAVQLLFPMFNAITALMIACLMFGSQGEHAVSF